MADEMQIILMLDMASENPIPMTMLDELIPPSMHRHVFRLSQFNVEATARGASQRQRRGWMIAVNKMLKAARDKISDSLPPPHYYVVGRVSLPIFAYVGLSLSKWAKITCVNSRPTGQWDVLPLHGTAPISSQERYFNIIDGLDSPTRAQRRGKVAVFVSIGLDCSDETIMTFMRSQDSELAGIVRIQAKNSSVLSPVKWLNADNVVQASCELAELFVSINNVYPDHEGLVLFVAGPGPLALMAGRAINPNLHEPIWIPNHEGSAYRPAIERPWGHGRTLKAFVATASPVDQEWLDIGGEMRAIRDEIERSGSRRAFEFRECHNARIDDIRRAMLEMRPHILHFSGHSRTDGVAFMHDRGTSHLVPTQAFIDLLEATNDSFLTLVILNSCESSEQAKALTRFVDCAIGMSMEIGDTVAREFAKSFYGGLARGRTVKNAFLQAKALLDAHGVPEGLVVLCTRDGLDADEIALVDPARHGVC